MAHSVFYLLLAAASDKVQGGKERGYAGTASGPSWNKPDIHLTANCGERGRTPPCAIEVPITVYGKWG